jgi:hypothetical protein
MAFTVDVPDYVIDASVEVCRQHNLGQRGDGSDGTQSQQLVGIIGENMVNVAIGRRLMEPTGQFDGGYDFELFGLRFDVKTMGRTCPPKINFVNNLIKQQTKFDVDAYIFCSLDTRVNRLTVCGWLPKLLLFDRTELYAKGTVRQRDDGTTFAMKTDTYEITNENLFHRAKSWPELFVELHKFSTEDVLT